MQQVEWLKHVNYGYKVMSNEQKIVNYLADGQFHSGEVLAEKLGISRAMVWKCIQTIRHKQKLQIDSVKGRGYRLPTALELLDHETILKNLSPSVRKIAHLHIYNSIDSTNSCLMNKASEGIPSGTCCIAEQQNAGRGRYGRTWISPYGKNIYLSLLWRYSLSPVEVSGLSLAAGVAILRVIRDLGIEDVGLKWPNDILWNEKKLAGLLLEVAGEGGGPCHVVIGVGINTFVDTDSAEKIDQPWIDLATIAGLSNVSRNQLAARTLEALIVCLESYHQQGLEAYQEDWKNFDLYYGKKVHLKGGDKEVVGIHQGIDKNGALLLRMGNETCAFHAGEVSLRPL